MSGQHTPGPWNIETKGSRHFIDGEDGLTIAYLDRRGVRDNAMIEANARLIASAPELLAALVDYVEHGESFAIRERALLAIAKAQAK